MTRKQHFDHPVEFDCCRRQGTISGVSIMPILASQARGHHQLAQSKLHTNIANLDKFQDVIDHNNECAWVFHELRPDDYAALAYYGFTVFLPLTKSGYERLVTGMLDMTDPPLDAIATRRERPACLYWWITAVHYSVFKIVPVIVNELLAPRYRCLDIIARIGSVAGGASMARVGFEPLREGCDKTGDLICYRRLANRGLNPALLEDKWGPTGTVRNAAPDHAYAHARLKTGFPEQAA